MKGVGYKDLRLQSVLEEALGGFSEHEVTAHYPGLSERVVDALGNLHDDATGQFVSKGSMEPRTGYGSTPIPDTYDIVIDARVVGSKQVPVDEVPVHEAKT